MAEATTTRATYADLLAVPGFKRLVVSSLLARVGGSMWDVAIVLFVLQRFHSPTLAGTTVFLSIFPGLLVSPIVGALLDRHGRVRLIVLDYVVFALAVGLLVVLNLTNHLDPVVLLPVVTVASLTGMLSISGVRSMIPLLLPRPLWDRGNAVDSSGYGFTAVIGPALAGLLSGFPNVFGGGLALAVTALVFVGAAVAVIGLREPPTEGAPGPLLRSALQAVRFVIRHPTLRGIALSMTVNNLAWGLLIVAVPVIVLGPLQGTSAQVGLLWALQGGIGVAGGLVFGRFDTEGRERAVMIATMSVQVVAILLMSTLSWAGLIAGIIVTGFIIGPSDIAMFSLRQRSTPVAWFGRAFAISMSMNFAGFPIGSALAGPLLRLGNATALLLAAGVVAVSAALAWRMIPSNPRVAAPD